MPIQIFFFFFSFHVPFVSLCGKIEITKQNEITKQKQKNEKICIE